MGVNKSVLEKMSSKELEKYIKNNSKFVPIAIEYAFEILNEREHPFSEEELKRWNDLKEKKQQPVLTKEVHPDYKTAANLMYISAIIGVLKLFFSFDEFNTIIIFTAVLSLSFVFGLAYLTGKGYDWMKYFLLVLFILGSISFLLNLRFVWFDLIFIIQTILQIWVLVILFRIPKNT